jgi:hypothetical protein
MQQERLTSERIDVAGLADAIEFYYEKGWTDGLPVIPATEERVREFLSHARRAPSDVIGVVPTRGRVITAEKVAINAVMAGCRPEYMPVLVAVIEAMCEPDFNYHGSQASTGSSAQLIVVSGPIAKELDINSGVNVFGPGVRANSTIGRAVRLINMNVTGGTPGILDKSTLGQGGKYSMCMAENEEASPWEPLHVQRGWSLNDNAVTVFAVFSPMQFSDGASNTPERLLDNMAYTMKGMRPGMGEFVIVLSPEHIRIFRNAEWSKRQAMEYLHNQASVSTEHLKRNGKMEGEVAPGDATDMHHIVETPEGIVFLVAGGDAGGFSSLISRWGGGGGSSLSITKPIRV